jgi:hypothetical protein
MPTRIDVINSCLVRIGSDPVADEQADGVDTHLSIFEDVTRYILAVYPWFFSTATRRLSRRVEAPAAHWKIAFELPTDMQGAPRAVFDRSDMRWPFTRYELKGRELHTDATEIWLTYPKAPPTSGEPFFWPGWFEELVKVAIMAEFALSIREDPVLRERLRENAYGAPHENGQGGLMGQAMAQDAQAKASAVIAEGVQPLIDVRR